MIQRWRWIIGGVFIGLLVGALAFAGIVQAAPDGAPLKAELGTAFTYQGYLEDGGVPANDTYDMWFKLWNGATGGAQIGGSVAKNGVAVSEGLFNVELDFGDVYNGIELWLAIEVRGPGDMLFTLLTPRQPMNATPFALYARSIPLDGDGVAGTAAHSDHNHLGQTWSGTAVYGLQVVDNSSSAHALEGQASSPSGTTYGVYGVSASSAGFGGYFENSGTDGVALYATGSGSGSSKATMRVHNSDGTGGVAASFTSQSSNETARFRNSVTGAVLYLQNGGDAVGAGGGDFIRAVNDAGDDVQFRVSTAGNVYADGGYNCGLSIGDVPTGPGSLGLTEASIDPCLRDNTPADFAEMLPAQGSPEPGDVLAIGPDGDLIQSSEAYQTTIIGVYSFRPSFLGNAQFADEDGYVPLAMLGIVPVKVSAENGAIQPGDLLVASSTPGHAMKASENPPQGTVIGKALEPLTEGTGFIQMIVTLQ